MVNIKRKEVFVIKKNKLVVPCTYQGSKQRYANQIIDIILEQNKINNNTKFYDLCCGTGAISLELITRGFNPNNIIMIDKSPWGLLWQSIGNETFNINKFEEYINQIPKDKFKIQNHIINLSKQFNEKDISYIYLLLQASSFGGKQIWIENNKWVHQGFRNYWQPTETSIRQSPVNPIQPMPNKLLERLKTIIQYCVGIKGIYGDLNEIKFENNSIVYIDPPYERTTGYNYNFNIHNFIKNFMYTYNLKLYVSEKEKLSDNAIRLNLKGAKGGISGNKKGRTEEWLNIFN